MRLVGLVPAITHEIRTAGNETGHLSVEPMLSAEVRQPERSGAGWLLLSGLSLAVIAAVSVP